MVIKKNGNYKSYEINLYANFCNINFNYKVISFSIWLKYVLIIIFIYFFIINFVKGNNNFNLNILL